MVLAKASVTRSSKLSFFIVEKSGKVVCAALNSAERRLLLAANQVEAAKLMGQELAVRGAAVKGVLGPTDASAEFCTGFKSQGGKTLEARALQNVLRLGNQVREIPKQASGLARVAKDKDLRQLLKWSRQFVEESGGDESERESEEVLRRYLEGRQLFIWEDAKPVAMAGYGGVTPNGVRVNMVYTDPAFRGKGYAGSLVNVVSRRLLADGHRNCFLYVEANNIAANRIYEKIGYKTVGDFIEYRAT